MKNIANYLSISRIIISIILAIIETFSFPFYILYIYCGISDMLDGYIARRTKSTSKIGARLDSIADIIFVIVAIVKILPVLSLSNGIVIWAIIITLDKFITGSILTIATITNIISAILSNLVPILLVLLVFLAI